MVQMKTACDRSVDFLSTFLSGFQENNTYPYAGVNIDVLAFSNIKHLCLESTMLLPPMEAIEDLQGKYAGKSIGILKLNADLL